MLRHCRHAFTLICAATCRFRRDDMLPPALMIMPPDAHAVARCLYFVTRLRCFRYADLLFTPFVAAMPDKEICRRCHFTPLPAAYKAARRSSPRRSADLPASLYFLSPMDTVTCASASLITSAPCWLLQCRHAYASAVSLPATPDYSPRLSRLPDVCATLRVAAMRR